MAPSAPRWPRRSHRAGRTRGWPGRLAARFEAVTPATCMNIYERAQTCNLRQTTEIMELSASVGPCHIAVAWFVNATEPEQETHHASTVEPCRAARPRGDLDDAGAGEAHRERQRAAADAPARPPPGAPAQRL